MLAALQGIYAGGPTTHWTVDEAGRPQYRYEARGGHITLFFESEPQGVEAVAAVWEAVRDLSVETADVFLILMSRIAELPDPRRDIARIRLDEIAEYRAVRRRRGTLHRLYEDFTREVLRLAELRLTMVWQDYRGRGTVAFGKPRPDHLLDIVGVELTRDGETWTAFGFRVRPGAGPLPDAQRSALGRPLCAGAARVEPAPGGAGEEDRHLLGADRHDRRQEGQAPRATIRTILAFCGEEPNWERPGRTVDAVIEVHRRLQEIGLLDELPVLEPPNRHKGFFRGWLDTPVSVRLSEDIWKISQAPDRARLPSPRKRRLPRRESAGQQPRLPLGIPDGPGQLQSDPALIRRFRMLYNVQQAELASALGITREVLIPLRAPGAAPARCGGDAHPRSLAAEGQPLNPGMPPALCLSGMTPAGRRPSMVRGASSRIARARGAPPNGVAARAAPVTGVSPRLAPSPV